MQLYFPNFFIIVGEKKEIFKARTCIFTNHLTQILPKENQPRKQKSGEQRVWGHIKYKYFSLKVWLVRKPVHVPPNTYMDRRCTMSIYGAITDTLSGSSAGICLRQSEKGGLRRCSSPTVLYVHYMCIQMYSDLNGYVTPIVNK